jgi:1-acyl-sn-glycerol-3-phosphate acyltransferase
MGRLAFGGFFQVARSVIRSVLLVLLLLAATVDLWIKRPRWGAEGAVWIHGWCRRIVAAMGIECSVTGTLPSAERGPVAVVSNHLSYLDILLYSAARPFIMVSKSEVKRWPLLGRLTAQAGTVYVDRGGGPPTYPAVNAAMAEAYKSGLPVLFFPEGTTTNGSEVLPFRRGLFHSVLNNGVELRTAALRFSLGEGNGSACVADDVCWWGDALFGPHIFRCLGLKGVSARIAFEETAVHGADRFELSERAREQVLRGYEGLGREMGAERAEMTLPALAGTDVSV